MRALASALSLFAMMACVVAQDAIATPLLSDPFHGYKYAGYGISILGRPGYSAAYSASDDRLRIESLVQGDFDLYDDEGPYFTSRLDIEAGVDALGNVTNSGYLIWYGDFGSGSQVLATAHLLDIGFGEHSVHESVNAWFSIRLLFEVDYLSPLLPGKSSFLGLWLEHGRASTYDSPFFEDWTCLALGDGTRCPEPYSTSWFGGLTVPEPAPDLLLLLSFVSLFLIRRKELLYSCRQEMK